MYAADNVSERSVRLLGGENSQEGIVEIAYNGRWGMVCNDNFSLTDAQSVCEGLGFNRDDASMMSLTSARYMCTCGCSYTMILVFYYHGALCACNC